MMKMGSEAHFVKSLRLTPGKVQCLQFKKSRSFKMYVNPKHLILIANLMTFSSALNMKQENFTPNKRDCRCQTLLHMDVHKNS